MQFNEVYIYAYIDIGFLCRDNEEERLRNFDDFLRICVQIAAGMEYIASCSFTHRDLATRNCLIADQQVIKIADFARMKSGYDHDYYKVIIIKTILGLSKFLY